MNQATDVSQLVISCTIPANQSRAVIPIDKKSFEKNVDLVVSDVLCKIDSTALYNIKQTNSVVLNGNQITIEEGYYTKDEIMEVLEYSIDFTETNLCYVTDGNVLNLASAPDLMAILKLPATPQAGVSAGESADFSNGLNCIRIYSNLIEQPIPYITTSLCDNFIYCALGLNNINSFTGLNLKVRKMSDLHEIEFNVYDRNDQSVSIPADIYLLLRLSVKAAI